jgi:hypothetical protein
MDVLMKLLFATDIGLLSLFTIVFLISMGLFIWWRISKNIREEEKG